jgi:hypothetical protein
MLDVAVHQSQVKCMLTKLDIIKEWCITVSKLKLNHITQVVVWTVLEHICNIVWEDFTVNWTSNDEWVCQLTLILLTWRIWWAPNNASRWQMEFNLAFKGLMNIFVGLTSIVFDFLFSEEVIMKTLTTSQWNKNYWKYTSPFPIKTNNILHKNCEYVHAFV